MCQGVSFGNGQHPTTRLAVRGVEYALNKTGLLKVKDETSVLDIGTGSGILGIAALLMGIKSAVGVDIDPCSIKEAKDNAKINRLENKFIIKNVPLEDLNNKFTLITANLRYPTLMNIYRRLVNITESVSAIVLSGIKSDEAVSVVDLYTEKYFECKWKEFEKGWAGLVFSRSAK
jgi:ribosomal protein L11 methyltransferase